MRKSQSNRAKTNSSSTSTYEGGAYGKMEGKAKTGYEKHHMPADAVSPISRYIGGAIQVTPADHKITASYGASKPAKAYRAKQKELIDQGDFRGAFEMDVRDIKSKFGNKYDGAIKQARDYYIREGMIKN